jgi:hypothetical protein
MTFIRGCGSPPKSLSMPPALTADLCGAHNHG